MSKMTVTHTVSRILLLLWTEHKLERGATPDACRQTWVGRFLKEWLMWEGSTSVSGSIPGHEVLVSIRRQAELDAGNKTVSNIPSRSCPDFPQWWTDHSVCSETNLSHGVFGHDFYHNNNQLRQSVIAAYSYSKWEIIFRNNMNLFTMKDTEYLSPALFVNYLKAKVLHSSLPREVRGSEIHQI